MGRAVFFWALALLSATASAISNPSYMVVVPAIIYHPNVEKVCLQLSSLKETVHVKVTLETQIQNHTLVEKDVDKPGIFECIDFKEEEVARVHVLVRKGGSVSFEGRKKVLIREAHPRVIIETDKPFYKPGETVKFRIVRLNEKFQALDDTISLIYLQDSNENRIGQWVDVKPRQGIVDLSFPLASEAPLGMYKIFEDSLIPGIFTVDEYELPKFEVSLVLPTLVTIEDEEFQVKVCGKYTYGKPVHGNVNLELKRDVSYFYRGDENETLHGIEKTYTGQTDKTGCAVFIIKGPDMNLTHKSYDTDIKLTAELEEEGTGVSNFGSDYVSVLTSEVRLSFINLNPFYKLGVPYAGQLKAEVYGLPVKNFTAYLTVDVDDKETHTQYVTDEDGIIHFSLDTTNWNNTLVSIRGRQSLDYGNQTEDARAAMFHFEAFNWLKPFYSESNSFLEIQHVEGELPCEKDQEVLVDYILDRNELVPGADHVVFYYLVVSKGKIVSSGQKEVPVGHDETLKGHFSLPLSTSFEIAPTARLLLFAVFADGEVAADVEEFKIDKCFKHKVVVDFSEKEELPGSKVNLQVEAAPGALCSLQAVDKSVLLKEDKTLTPEKVYRNPFSFDDYTISGRGFVYHLEDFEPYPCLLPRGQKQKRSLRVAPWYQSEADVYSLFKSLRLKIFTNSEIKKPVSCDPIHERQLFTSARNNGGLFPQPFPVVHQAVPFVSETAAEPKKEKAKPRTNFPESWIWHLVPVNQEGKATHPVTVPDTITEWKVNAFCVADIGFGLSEQAGLTVFQPFFADLLVPYSVVRGEILQLKAIVFNYLKDCIQVRVDLAESQQLEVKPCPTCQFTACLCEDEAKTFSWNVTATELGHVNVSVTAEAEENHDLCGNQISVTPARGRSDTVVKSLLVKSEGSLEEETHNAFLCSSGDGAVEEISLQLPEAFVKDSARATISAIGDIMGTALNHVSKLLQMPFGCGEQNIAKLAPNIFILRYLENTNQVTPEIKQRATEFMKAGYQRQLLYKHDNGSYSAFGKRDAQGNTWLTAFVLRTLEETRRYIFTEDKNTQESVHWLGQHQLPDGRFENVGRIFNNAIMGGVNHDLSLTGYVTASLLELQQEKNVTMIDSALLYLKKNLSSVEDAYSKALLAYVFTLAGDTETRQQLLGELDKEADKTEGSRSFSDIETTAYYLLAYLSTPEVSADDLKHGSEIVRALTQRMNSYGGFRSTQDTVVALQALSRYAALTYREIESLTALVTSSQGFRHEFHVDRENRLVLQQASLPKVPGQYKVEVTGNGCMYVQATVRYNSLPQEDEKKVFALEVETFPKECNQTTQKHFDITLRVSYTGNRQTSNMALIEVNLLSGFVPVKTSVKTLENEPRVKKVEFDPDKINIYLDWLDKSVQSYSLSVQQEVEVTDLKPAIVKLYDYYHPDDNVVAEYNAPCSTVCNENCESGTLICSTSSNNTGLQN
ncbi:alpha-2-macroglobulin-like protein 1 [Tiliqua scincoides]|uniref:alpha-2-macroglobulin-like protein 1 n=1 Tax=Tiliqua scincoides TaxID=71010 RepID=UPI0034634788